ncbi:MAG: hypothetical protein PHE89_07220 [Alphaproteobacteria bacterium]|nr:hypothetical protein [Alphaproteobacteria bacterium]
MESKKETRFYLKNRRKVIRLIKSLDPVIKTEAFQIELANSNDGELIKLYFYSGGYHLPNDWKLNFSFNFILEIEVYRTIRTYGIVSFVSAEAYMKLEKYLEKSSRNQRTIGLTSYLENGSISFNFVINEYSFLKKKNNSVSHFKKNNKDVAKSIHFPKHPKDKVFKVTVLKFKNKVAIAIR